MVEQGLQGKVVATSVNVREARDTEERRHREAVEREGDQGKR